MAELLHDNISLDDQEETDSHEAEPSCELYPYSCPELLVFRLLQTK